MPSVDEPDRIVVYLAEDSQLGHLPHEVAVALAQQSPIQDLPRGVPAATTSR